MTSTWLAETYRPRAPVYVLTRAWSAWDTGAAALIAAFAAVETLIVTVAAKGPTLDEAIYLTAGQRLLDGHGMSDGYLAWFAGSLGWPALAGLGDTVAGLAGARLLAALFVTIALFAMWRAAAALFDARAGFFAVALGVASGPVLALGHLAVIDTPAVAGVAVALWGVAELGRTGDRKWLVLAAGAFSLGVLAKYPAIACGLPLLLVLVVLRGRRAAMDAAIFVLITGAVLITYFLSARGPLSYFLTWRTSNNPTFGVTPEMIAFSQLWYGGLPVLLALGGWVACGRRSLGAALLVGAVPFPLYVLVTGSSVGDTKHMVFGFVFLLPLAGVLLGRLARWPAGAVVALILAAAAGVFGARQAELMERAWIDLDPATRYLSAHARPGQDYLIDNSWPFIHRLYEDGRVRDPWNVYDTYRVAHHQLPKPVCRVDWFVVAQGAGAWPARVRRQVDACGTFKRVYARKQSVTNIGRDLSFVKWDGRVEIYRNVRAGRSG
ncbi:MAG: glycosyltransferase family 39 protein [Thermoleophilaceae bacterium]|nr:glycosyltransferase family 39 protein [Thermoleophilaceae bacterium]